MNGNGGFSTSASSATPALSVGTVGTVWSVGSAGSARLAWCAAILLVFALTLPVLAQTGYIDAREFAQSQGIKEMWYPIQKIMVLRKDGKIVHLRIDSLTAHINNEPFGLASPPRLVDGNVMVPARSLVQIFSADTQATLPPPHTSPGPEYPPAPPRIIPPPEVPQIHQEAYDPNTKLVTVRHSIREDHTRVVLEFDGTVRYSLQQPDANTVKLYITGCRNLIPTSRSNPIGRDLANVAFNSGPDRQGLVLTFSLTPGTSVPTIETIADPYRMILSFHATTTPPPDGLATTSREPGVMAGTTTATATVTAAVSGTATGEKPGADTRSGSASAGAGDAPLLHVPPPKTTAPQPPPDINIDVPAAVLAREAFKGRAVTIDPGHGGSDPGIQIPGLPSEKEITLDIAVRLAAALEERGFTAYLLRQNDANLNTLGRRALANRAGGDLFLSLHCGGSIDDRIAGIACFTYDKNGKGQTEIDQGQRHISAAQVFTEWLTTTRFDLATYLGDKLCARLTQHLGVSSRGLRSLPLYQLRFLIYPAVLVEVGMLTNPEEGQRLASPGYREAIARSLANGVVDFFNGIRLQDTNAQ